MPTPLRDRSQCVHNGCTCASFFVIEAGIISQPPRTIPFSAMELCRGCQHPWIGHLGGPLSGFDQNHYYNRGGYLASNCGGFYSPEDVWANTPNCVCGAAFVSHFNRDTFAGVILARAGMGSQLAPERPPLEQGSAPVERPVESQALLTFPPAISLPSSTLSSAALLPSFRPPPIQAFTPALQTQTANQARSQSMQRQRIYRATAARGGARQHVSTGATPPPVVNTSFDVGIWPMASSVREYFVVEESNNTALLEHLKNHGLMFEFTLPRGTTGRVALNIMKNALQECLSQGGYMFSTQNLPGLDENDYNSQPWVLLQGTRKTALVTTFKSTHVVNTQGFLEPNLKKGFAGKFKGEFAYPKPLIYLAPRNGHLRRRLLNPVQPLTLEANVFAPNEPHSCIGRRILFEIPLSAESTISENTCIASLCPTNTMATESDTSEVVMATVEGSAGETRSTLNNGFIQSRIRSYSNAMGHDEPIDESASRYTRRRMVPEIPVQETPTAPSSPHHNFIPTLQPIQPAVDLASRREGDVFINKWVAHCRTLVLGTHGCGTHIKALQIFGKSPMCIAKHIYEDILLRQRSLLGITLVLNLDPDDVWETNTGDVPFGAYLPRLESDAAPYTTGPDRLSENFSIGIGVERGVWVAANAEAFQNQGLWSVGEYGNRGLRPTYTQLPKANINQDSLAQFMAAGAIVSLRLLHLGHVEFINSWLLAVLMLGPCAFDVPFDVIKRVDPLLAAVVEPWFLFDFVHDTAPLPLTHPVQSLMIEVFGVANPLSRRKTPELQKIVTRMILAKLTLGAQDPWDLAEIESMQRGFNARLSRAPEGTLLLRTCAKFLPEQIVQMLHASTNRRLTSSEEVVEKLVVRGTSHHNITLRTIAKIIKERVIQYLQGVGHPPGLRGGVVSEEIFDQDQTDGGLRARLLLDSLTDSDMLPSDADWKISLGVEHPRPNGGNNRNTDMKPMVFHVCSCHADIPVTEHLKGILAQYVKPGHSSLPEFDDWFHQNLMANGRTSGYNTL
ncbi:hypothetical protein CPB83DRAFT_887971 [Crepidotus variabilis]|uniref:Uncharacterized protein n=1 Tax=Crepidotus variabilis TaxID=179855 RepID=A0A9P6ESD7_9AGAR|nr:hypothetical protein CPB83DRAFT_887971 [Crepidotus variabilis]